jgi:hypothetical protein
MSITLNQLTGGSPGSYTYDKAGSATNPIGGYNTLSSGTLAPGTQNAANNIVTSVIRTYYFPTDASGKVIKTASATPAGAIGQNADGSYIYATPNIYINKPNFSSVSGTDFYIPPPLPGQSQFVDPITGDVTNKPATTALPEFSGVGILLVAALALVMFK